jgi:Lar family restriction alleviation protein
MATAAKTAFASIPDACPFCGSARSALQEIELGSWMVECLDCHATGPVKAATTAAEQAWNCRLPYLRQLEPL